MLKKESNHPMYKGKDPSPFVNKYSQIFNGKIAFSGRAEHLKACEQFSAKLFTAESVEDLRLLSNFQHYNRERILTNYYVKAGSDGFKFTQGGPDDGRYMTNFVITSGSTVDFSKPCLALETEIKSSGKQVVYNYYVDCNNVETRTLVCRAPVKGDKDRRPNGPSAEVTKKCGFLNSGVVDFNEYSKKKMCYFPISCRRDHPILLAINYDKAVRQYPNILNGVQFFGRSEHLSVCEQFGGVLLTMEYKNQLKLIQQLMYGLPEILLTNYTIDNSSLKLSNYGPDRGKFMKDLLKESGITKLPVSNDTKCVALRVEPNEFLLEYGGVLYLSFSSLNRVVCVEKTAPFTDKTVAKPKRKLSIDVDRTYGDCGFLNGGYVVLRSADAKAFCFFPVSRDAKHWLYKPYNFTKVKRAFPLLFIRNKFKGLIEQEQICQMFGAKVATLGDRNEHLVFNRDEFVSRRQTRILLGYHFINTSIIGGYFGDDLTYVVAKFNENKLKCPKKSEDCCLTIDKIFFKSSKVPSYKLGIATCSDFQVSTVVCRLIRVLSSLLCSTIFLCLFQRPCEKRDIDVLGVTKKLSEDPIGPILPTRPPLPFIVKGELFDSEELPQTFDIYYVTFTTCIGLSFLSLTVAIWIRFRPEQDFEQCALNEPPFGRNTGGNHRNVRRAEAIYDNVLSSEGEYSQVHV
uniref:RNA helicase n=1 Tax=Syphacia muris TaxID=451379 RepID=A0A0N5AMV5_9BILA